MTRNRDDLGEDIKPYYGLLELQPPSKKALQLMHYWVPPAPQWRIKKNSNSSLNIAGILGDTLYQGLRYEGNLFLLTPYNWRDTLKYAGIDFLLVESTWFTATGHWKMALSVDNEARREIEALIRFARQLEIPTIFWNTADQAYHDHYKDICKKFDRVYCADPHEQLKLHQEGVSASVLLPAIQPAIHNPMRFFQGKDNDFELGTLYDGWTDILRLGDRKRLLKKIAEYDLWIIESRHSLTLPQKSRSPKYLRERILGCVNPSDLPNILKHSKQYLTLSETQDTNTRQAWKTIEAAACRLPVIHYGSFEDSDFRASYHLSCKREGEVLIALERLKNDIIYRERMAQKTWRFAFKSNTFSNRVRQICKDLNIPNDWSEYPRAAIITPTIRPELFEKTLDQYERQTYPNKELVIVYNGDEKEARPIIDLAANRKDVKAISVPNEYFSGTCLTLGGLHSNSDICFRVDDDDHYGDNYLLDCMLYLRVVDAKIFGKPFTWLNIEADGFYHRKTNHPPPYIFYGEDLGWSNVGICGCSMAGHKDFLSKNYPDDNALSADAVLISNINELHPGTVCMSLDAMNMVVERKSDPSKHTWRSDNDALKTRSVKIDCQISDIMT